MTRSLKVLTAAALCSLWALTPVAAVEQFSGPCAEMVSRFCKDVTPGGGRVMKCLSEHQDAQSAGCRDWLADQNKSLKDLNGACPEEIARLCSSYPGDGVRLFLCLEDNYVSLKSDCREKLREIKDRMQ